MCLKLRHAKFQPLTFTPREIFSNLGLNGWGVAKMCVFQPKTAHIWETVRDTA